jgi:hypothetical protein
LVAVPAGAAQLIPAAQSSGLKQRRMQRCSPFQAVHVVEKGHGELTHDGAHVPMQPPSLQPASLSQG